MGYGETQHFMGELENPLETTNISPIKYQNTPTMPISIKATLLPKVLYYFKTVNLENQNLISVITKISTSFLIIIFNRSNLLGSELIFLFQNVSKTY